MIGMSQLIVVTGPPGAGKSTLAAELVTRFEPSALVAGDELFAFVREGYVDPWKSEAHGQNGVVTAAAAAATGRFVEGGYTVVDDGIVGPWFLAAFAAGAGVERLHYIVLMPSEDLCLERVQSRSRHGFRDLDAAAHMYREFASAQLADRHVVTGLGTVEDNVSEVLRRIEASSTEWSTS
jgi:adenylate kinase family enzyme